MPPSDSNPAVNPCAHHLGSCGYNTSDLNLVMAIAPSLVLKLACPRLQMIKVAPKASQHWASADTVVVAGLHVNMDPEIGGLEDPARQVVRLTWPERRRLVDANSSSLTALELRFAVAVGSPPPRIGAASFLINGSVVGYDFGRVDQFFKGLPPAAE
jgi:hypothetical protein